MIGAGRLRWRIAALKNGFLDATAYRIEFLFEILGSALVPTAIQWILWYAMFTAGGATEVRGLTYADALSYTFVSLLFTQIRGGDHDFELQEMIRTGQLSNYLLRPAGVVEFVYLRGLAPKLLIAAVGIAVGVIASFFWDGISAPRMLCAMALAFVGNVIHYQMGAALATTAFLWEEAFSVLMVKNLLVSLFSGELLPLTLFPPWMEPIWKSMPFYLYVFGPTQMALGKWSYAEFAHHLMIGCLWMLVGWAVVRATWAVGTKRYLSLGG